MATDVAGRHVVVSGGCGFLGSHLCDVLINAGARVTCLDNERTGSANNVRHLVGHPDFDYRRCDVTTKLPTWDHVDAVLHLASIASPLAYARMPLETLRSGSIGTLNLIELAATHEARFVFASTSEVYGDPEVHPQPESYWGHVNPVGPRAPYDESKRFGEAVVVGARAERGVDAGIVRIFNTYGPRMAFDDGRMVPAFIDQAERGEPLTVAGDGSQTRSLCYVDDTVDALLRMTVSDLPGPVNIGNPTEQTVLEIAHEVLRITGSSSTIAFVPRPTDDPERRNPDITLARNELAWQPDVGLEDGLRRTIAWYREHAGRSSVMNRSS